MKTAAIPVVRVSPELRQAAEAVLQSGETELLDVFPFSCRKASGGGGNPFLRELIIPFGSPGYVALFEIENRDTVTLLAVRHQKEERRKRTTTDVLVDAAGLAPFALSGHSRGSAIAVEYADRSRSACWNCLMWLNPSRPATLHASSRRTALFVEARVSPRGQQKNWTAFDQGQGRNPRCR